MNNHALDNKVRKDVATLKKDLSTLETDRAVSLSKFGANINQASEDVTNWVGDGVGKLGEGLGKLADDAKTTMGDAAASVKKDVGQGFNHYNNQAQAAANRVPGGFAQKVVRYPWVALSIALVAGFMLGRIRKPNRKFVQQYQI